MRRASYNNGGGRGSVIVGSRTLASINNSALDTINAAASRITSVDNRSAQAAAEAAAASAQKKKWGGCWTVYWCFGYQRRRKRIGHAVFIPETQPSGSGNELSPAENHNQQHPPPPQVVLPFMAPPSSPASFVPSEPPSVTQSPAGQVSLSMYSPPGPSSIFAIGPYAHETQLVSPPAFSTFNTEPSTAPFTPPPESVHLTNTPSSPEVPFAQLLERFPLSHYEFQHYQFHPGSPAGQLISPRSGISCSGTSSPFMEGDFTAVGFPFMEFRGGSSRQGSGTLTPDSTMPAGSSSRSNFVVLDRQSSDLAGSHRVFFELTAGARLTPREEPIAASSLRSALESIENGIPKPEREEEKNQQSEGRFVETSNNDTQYQAPDAPTHCRHRTITLGCSNDFDFGSSGREELDDRASHVLGSHQESAASNFVLDRQSSDLGELPQLDGGREKNQVAYQRVFFEWTADDRLLHEEPQTQTQTPSSVENSVECRDNGSKPEREAADIVGESRVGVEEAAADGGKEGAGKGIPTHCRHRTITLGCIKDFDDFEEEEEDETEKHSNNNGPDWWANGKQGEEGLENWSFFPVVQPEPGTVS